MHHFAFHGLKTKVSHKFSFPKKVSPFQKVSPRIIYKPTRTIYTRANVKKKMDSLEHENRVLREEMTAMQAKMDEMAEVMKTMAEAQVQAQAQAQALAQAQAQALAQAQSQAQAPPPPPPIRTQAGTSAAPGWTICVETPTHSAPQRSMPRFSPFTAGEILRPIVCEASNSIPEGCPWAVPVCLSEVFRPIISEVPMPTHQNTAHVPPPHVRAPPAAMTYSAPVMHTLPQDEEPIYHSGDMEAYDRVNDLQQKYDEIQRDVRALHGKKMFGKTAYDLCLVPDVQVPHKFKVPDFEKYKGNSCLEEHLTMYVRRM
jgi:hypothetical protein